MGGFRVSLGSKTSKNEAKRRSKTRNRTFFITGCLWNLQCKLFGLCLKFINQLFKVSGFLWPRILIEVKFIRRKTQECHPTTLPLTKMTATFFYFDIFQKFLRICVSNTKCQKKIKWTAMFWEKSWKSASYNPLLLIWATQKSMFIWKECSLKS